MLSDNKIDIINRQKAAQTNQSGHLSSTPYYIQNLERKIDRLEYKIDLLVAELNKSKDT